jgi:hypothetical protein
MEGPTPSLSRFRQAASGGNVLGLGGEVFKHFLARIFVGLVRWPCQLAKFHVVDCIQQGNPRL